MRRVAFVARRGAAWAATGNRTRHAATAAPTDTTATSAPASETIDPEPPGRPDPVFGGSDLLGVLTDIADSGQHDAAGSAIVATGVLSLERPVAVPVAFSVVLPPLWAAEVPRRLRAHFARTGAPFPMRQPALYAAAFVAADFARGSDASASDALSMASLAPLGEAVLLWAVDRWLAAAGAAAGADAVGGSAAARRVSVALLSDRTLAAVCTAHWRLSDAILTGGAGLAALQNLGQAQRRELGQAGPGARTGGAGAAECADCVRALVAAVYVDRGLEAAVDFAQEHVLAPGLLHAQATLT